jgi:hypothetical protein
VSLEAVVRILAIDGTLSFQLQHRIPRASRGTAVDICVRRRLEISQWETRLEAKPANIENGWVPVPDRPIVWRG